MVHEKWIICNWYMSPYLKENIWETNLLRKMYYERLHWALIKWWQKQGWRRCGLMCDANSIYTYIYLIDLLHFIEMIQSWAKARDFNCSECLTGQACSRDETANRSFCFFFTDKKLMLWTGNEYNIQCYEVSLGMFSLLSNGIDLIVRLRETLWNRLNF